MNPLESLNEFLGNAEGWLWTWAGMPVVILLGLYFTVRTGVVQLRMIPAMLSAIAPPSKRGYVQGMNVLAAPFLFAMPEAPGLGVVAIDQHLRARRLLAPGEGMRHGLGQVWEVARDACRQAQVPGWWEGCR